MITSIIGFFTGQWQRLLIYGLVILMALGTAAGWGYHRGVLKLYEYQAKQAQEAVKIITKQGAVTEVVRTEYVKVREKAKVVERTVTQEVVKYVDKNPGMCLDAEWGRLFDASTGAVPDSSGGTDGTGGAPTAAKALETVTQNNARCIRTADKLDGLQSWIVKQRAVKP